MIHILLKRRWYNIEIILNEKKYAENILKTGDLGNKPSFSINLISRYYKQVEGLTYKKILKKVDVFMQENYKKYNSVRWSKTLEKYAKTAGKYPLSEINYIAITQSELEYIKDVGDLRLERLMFSLLCCAKLYNAKNPKNNNWEIGRASCRERV